MNFSSLRGDNPMIIHNYEKSLRSTECVKYLTRSGTLSEYNTLIALPIPTSRDGVRLTNTDTGIDEVLERTDAGTLVIGYDIPREWTDKLIKKHATVCDSGLDEKFLCENGRLTAECTIGILLSTAQRSLSEMTFGIVGYGRIGKWLLCYLSYFSAGVVVYTRSLKTRLDLGQTGIFCPDIDSAEIPENMDVLINTAPDVVLCEDGFSKNKSVRVIDLASGDNFPWLNNVEKYPSIPAKMLPRSAGLAWARSVERFVNNNT